MKILLVLMALLVVGCQLDEIVSETPEFRTYAQGWIDGWEFCIGWGWDTFATDGSINAFLEDFDIPVFGEDRSWASEVNFRGMNEYQWGAWDAFHFMIRNY